MKRLFKIFIIVVILFPHIAFAYSDKIVVGGDTIGIEVKSDGLYVVGFYDVLDKKIAKDAGFLIGDVIKKINNIDINEISNIDNIIVDDSEYSFLVYRANKYINIKFRPINDNNLIKTGLYVKDQINGIGTISYIDPETGVFGALGHEIIESNSMTKFNIRNGKIFKAEVSSIKKGFYGSNGEKNAYIDYGELKGDIYKNEVQGIFGKYNSSYDGTDVMQIGDVKDIKKGDAFIRTVIDKDIKEDFKINIISIDESSNNKNILFEINDKKLLSKTGGIIQGMSGSPIIQSNKIIGVVNFVIVDDITKGYGIFITSMLKEGDKVIS